MAENEPSAKFAVLSDEDDEPECICCPVRDVCKVPPGTTVRITKDIRNRSGCDGDVFDTWDDVLEIGGEP